MKARFFIRTIKANGEAPLYVRVRSDVKGIDIKQSTGLTVDARAWKKSLKSAKAKEDYQRAEGSLHSKMTLISEMVETLDEEGLDITADMLKERIFEIVNANQIAAEKERQKLEAQLLAEQQKESFNEFVLRYIRECETGERLKEGTTKRIALGTIRSYRGFYAQLEAYQRNRHIIIDFPDVTVAFYEDFKRFLLDKQYSPNTIARMIKICKSMCYAAERMKLFDAKEIRGSVKAIPKDVDNIYLTEERIQELYEADLSSNPAWDKVRDVFVVGCLSGQRVSDYKLINKKMIVTLSDGQRYLKIRQKKTGKIVYPPLDYRIENILNKYGGVLPKVFDQKINDYIKKIGEMLGWTEIVEMDEQRGSMEYTAKRRFCDMIKTHTARRSFATNMYRTGASLSSIMAITGHSSEAQLRVYLKLSEEEKAVEASKEKFFQKNRLRVAQ